ncbi:hypothetical protein BDM02DRAFT_3271879 [Thelephora ganbajun]|uniref:Uncharacterized protein n=1 Tax=Thelephora ganbajun TaxID=370292 RepID=A0ACB6Z630_THEGA|nr:hypothetical protein BDM02DRAFT_3271879 [Thelephora ganbajun]
MSLRDRSYSVVKGAPWALKKLLRILFFRIPARNYKTESSAQTSLIFSLSDDIFVEILSHFTTFKLHELYYRIDQLQKTVAETRHLPRVYATRHRILLTLTHACRDMRKRFSPWLLEHVQSLCVYKGFESDDQKRECRQLARKSLLRQIKVLIASPTLAVHVQTMSINLHHQTISSIVQCLALLPNLHTLEVTTSDNSRAVVKDAFTATRLPQVRTLAIDPDAHHIIRCCENVKHVIIHRYSVLRPRYLKSITQVKQSITRVGLCAFQPEVVGDLARLFPELRELSLVQPFDVVGSLEHISYFKRLRLLELVQNPRCHLVFDSSWQDEPETTDQNASVMEHAITVLTRIRGHSKVLKMIIIEKDSIWGDIRDVKTEVIEVP